jgi:hypothetical protein
MRLKIGDIIFNTRTREHFPGVPTFVKGYYKVVDIQEGYLTQFLKPEDRLTYIISRCTKDALRLMKYVNGMKCKYLDKEIDSGGINIIRS